MSHIYTQERTPATSNLKALFLGILGVTAIFGILPLLTGIPDLFNRIPITPPDEIALQRPPEIPVEPPKPEIKKDKIEIKDLEEPLPLITPDQMALLLNPSHNGAGVYVDTGISFLEGDDTSMTTFMQSELDQQPRALVAAKPLYPYSMQHTKTKGQVTVEFIIDETGRVLRPRIISASHRDFEQAALDAVTKSKWQPGRKNGKDVRTLVRLPVNFKP